MSRFKGVGSAPWHELLLPLLNEHLPWILQVALIPQMPLTISECPTSPPTPRFRCALASNSPWTQSLFGLRYRYREAE